MRHEPKSPAKVVVLTYLYKPAMMNKNPFKRFLFAFLLIFPLASHASAPESNTSILRVGIYHNPPKLQQNTNGQPEGVFVDVIKQIAKEESIQLHFVYGEWSDLMEQLRLGSIDVLPDVARSPERDTQFVFTKLNLLSSWLEFFVPDTARVHAMSDLSNLRIGVLKGSLQADLAMDDQLSAVQLQNPVIPYADYSLLTDALQSGAVDAILASRFFYFSKQRPANIRPSGLLVQATELHFAFSKQAGAQWADRFDVHLASMKNDARSVYYKSIQYWLGNMQQARLSPVLYGLIITGFVMLLMLILFIWTLRFQIKRRTAELWEAKEKAEESDLLKTLFLQNLSHEVRTPMNSIMGFLELMQEGGIDEAHQITYSKQILQSSHRLFDTLNNMVEIALMETGQKRLRIEPIQVDELMSRLQRHYQPLFDKAKLNLAIPLDPSEATTPVESDPDIVYAVLHILLSNALKFTQSGGAEIRWHTDADGLHIHVKDTGQGIPESRQQVVFDRFVQGDASLSRPYEGAGLGLALVKSYMTMLKGQLNMHSIEQSGTSFDLFFPSLKKFT